MDARLRFASVVTALGLAAYDDLADPTAPFPAFFNAFSRAKDELVPPGCYRMFVDLMPDGEERARAAEVSRAYATYQAMLARENGCDFGDLLLHAVALLHACPDVRDSLRAQYRHLLVDEYQDVNRASRAFLQLLAGDGAGLWVVGDPRQAIFGFRGASDRNVRDFPRDFPGARATRLARNYRSRPAIVATVSALAPHVGAVSGESFVPWDAHRAERRGAVSHTVCADADAEADLLATEMARLRDAGVPLRDQAVLCRSHGALARIGARLVARDIPTLALGDLFERPEVRDLLSLLALAVEPDGRGLMRVARFPAYRVPDADLRLLLATAQPARRVVAPRLPFPAALSLAATLPGLSDAGRAGLRRLAAHLAAAMRDDAGPHTLLARFLFDIGEHLLPLVEDPSVAGQQRRIAVYQFLEFVYAAERRPGDGAAAITALLRYVRAIEIGGEDRRFSQLPSWADGIEAVRLLTVHAAKGLEFAAVFIPELRDGQFPARGRAEQFPCPPPPGLRSFPLPDADRRRVADDDAPVDDGNDEDCLAFVALSRARDELILTRPAVHGKRNTATKPPPWMVHIAGTLDERTPPAAYAPTTSNNAETAAGDRAVEPREFSARQLDDYLRCPRRYAYDTVWGFRERRARGAYEGFTRAVYETMADVIAERLAPEEARERFAARWEMDGPPASHPYRQIYRGRGEKAVARAVAAARDADAATVETFPALTLPNGHRVRVSPDVVVREPDGRVRLQRWLTGKKPKHTPDDDLYGLYTALGRRENPDAFAVEAHYLASDPPDVTVRTNGQGGRADTWVTNRLQHYADAADGLVAGVFDPKPSERICPRCPYYFICPGAARADGE